MGRGERIGAVRYIGDRAYVVTFAEVGALYVVDLSGPAEPAVRGELKIPGYSAYLHPIGDGLLAGVGRHATGDGRILGAKVSLFDISQAAGPREIDTWTLAGDAQSGTEWDHRSFLWWPPEQLMVLPVSAWGEQWGDEVSNRVAVFEITPAGGLDHRGYIDHSTTDRAFATDCHYEFDSEEREALDEGWNVPLLLACTPEQAGNPFGYHCKTIAATQAWGWSVDVDALKTDVGADDRIQLCWPYEFENIDRTLIIGDNLWTLSRSLLQSNNLDTLQRRTRLVLRN